MRTVLVIFSVILFGISSPLYSQSSGGRNIFSKKWVYPDTPDSLIKPVILGLKKNGSSSVHQNDSAKVFSNIAGMGCDKNDNLYVWDAGYLALWKFSPDGTKLWRDLYKNGKGDGEFINAGPAFAVSKNGKICIGDKVAKTITILDGSGNFISKFKVDMMPSSAAFGNDESLYITGFPFTYKGDLIQHYDINGKYLDSFGERKDMTKEVMWSGNSGKLSVDKDGNICFAWFYPYRVEKYSPAGQLLSTIENKDDEFTAPKYVTVDNRETVDWTSGLRGIINIDKNYMAVIAEPDKNTGNWRIDLYNSDKLCGEILSDKDMPFNFSYRFSAIDSKGNLYFDVLTESGSIIIKYDVAYSDVRK